MINWSSTPITPNTLGDLTWSASAIEPNTVPGLEPEEIPEPVPFADIYAAGSLGAHIRDQFFAAVDGRAADDAAKKIFTTEDHATPSYVQNAACWAAGWDLSAFSPYNTFGVNKRMCHAITPRHVVCAAHYMPNGGGDNVIRFVDADGSIIERGILRRDSHPDYTNYFPDIGIAVLDADLPESVMVAKILPDGWESYLPSVADGSASGLLPVFGTDQEHKALIFTLDNVAIPPTDPTPDWTTYTDCKYLEPTQPEFGPFYEPVIVGDSGGTRAWFVNGEMVLLSTVTQDPAGDGTWLARRKTEINDLIAYVDSLVGTSTGYTVQTVDLSSFTSFAV